ncbi:hypothetical protein BOX15_Mlig007083g2, partial [Macrostomum lignano]
VIKFYLNQMGCIQSGPTFVVDGRSYRIVENIGEGGFSQVDLCREEKSNRLCVAKRILCHSRADSERAVREAEYHRKLRHPNLLTCLGHSVGQPITSVAATVVAEVILVLPYHRRGTLSEELDLCRIAKSSIGLNRILSTISGLCSGLAAMHSADLAHRDLKTGNVLLDDSLRPILMDFGSVTDKLVWINSRQEAVRWQDFAAEHCSMTYRAPELYNVPCPGIISEKADIWSLGCVLYALCYNESPFDPVYSRGDSVALATCSGIKLPTSPEFDYPSELQQLILSMGNPDPDRRPSLAEIRTVLAPLLISAGLPTEEPEDDATEAAVVSQGDVRLTSVAHTQEA